MSEPLLKIDQVTRRYGATVAVDRVSLSVADGEFLALLGPSGCGKTTLLRMLGGFDKPDEGRIWMDGADITDLPPNKRALNMLFQSYAVFPHMTVGENIAYGLRVDGVPREETDSRVKEALALVHLAGYEDRLPEKLSGGQRQRVALARALIKRPRVLLLDEPLSALDAKLREAMQMELVKLQKTVGITFIVVTHDQDEALSMATRIAVMEKGQFRQIADPRTLYESPNCEFVADFVGRMNLLPCTITDRGADTVHIHAEGVGEWTIALDTLAVEPETGKMAAGIRPENLIFTEQPLDSMISCSVTVESLSYYGGDTLLQCRSQGGYLFSVILTNRHRTRIMPTVGQAAHLSWLPTDLILFPE